MSDSIFIIITDKWNIVKKKAYESPNEDEKQKNVRIAGADSGLVLVFMEDMGYIYPR